MHYEKLKFKVRALDFLNIALNNNDINLAY